MIVQAQQPGEFVVAYPDDFTKFHLEINGCPSQEFAALLQASPYVEPHDDPRHVWVSVAFLRRELGTANHPTRRDGLQEMLAFAAAKGWLHPAGTHVAAHIQDP